MLLAVDSGRPGGARFALALKRLQRSVYGAGDDYGGAVRGVVHGSPARAAKTGNKSGSADHVCGFDPVDDRLPSLRSGLRSAQGSLGIDRTRRILAIHLDLRSGPGDSAGLWDD